MLGFRIALSLASVLVVAPLREAAAQSAARNEPDASDAPADDGVSVAYRKLAAPPGGSARFVGTLAFGGGLRFNNPYRLQTQLEKDAASLSITSGYMDLGAAASFGPADGVQHGAALHLSIALSGVAQQSITPSYFIAYRGPHPVLGYGRLGAAILTAPDLNVGAEIAGGLGYFLTGRIALTGEVVGDLFYGAATYDATYTVYPIVSAQLGLMVDYELLP